MAESGEGESWPPEQGKKTAVPLPALGSSAAFTVSSLRSTKTQGEDTKRERKGG